ncbi:hypothetical protein GJ496_010277 [Pomphorhynchus laevis]|nr:hypothetical protein GJ496_010277 [Pomphorhynchus laevis]
MNNYRRGKHVKLRKRGLYDPFMEKGACGVGLVANVKGVASYELLENAKTMLLGMAHRGATVRETGDGAGLMARIPHDLYKQKLKKSYDIDLPPEGRYATGIIFTDTKDVIIAKSRFTEICSEYGLEILCWRNVPVNNDAIGPAARYDEPFILQVFVVLKDPTVDFFQQLLVIRKQASAKILEEIDRFYIVSISAKIIVYKGRFDAAQLWEYYLDLHDPLFITNFAIVHARFATNTFPTWELAQPFR